MCFKNIINYFHFHQPTLNLLYLCKATSNPKERLLDLKVAILILLIIFYLFHLISINYFIFVLVDWIIFSFLYHFSFVLEDLWFFIILNSHFFLLFCFYYLFLFFMEIFSFYHYCFEFLLAIFWIHLKDREMVWNFMKILQIYLRHYLLLSLKKYLQQYSYCWNY